jgi:hypothetical protein
MGYRGLLLNDPYKIDRMMGCVCGYISFLFFVFYLLVILAIRTKEYLGGENW